MKHHVIVITAHSDPKSQLCNISEAQGRHRYDMLQKEPAPATMSLFAASLHRVESSTASHSSSSPLGSLFLASTSPPRGPADRDAIDITDLCCPTSVSFRRCCMSLKDRVLYAACRLWPDIRSVSSHPACYQQGCWCTQLASMLGGRCTLSRRVASLTPRKTQSWEGTAEGTATGLIPSCCFLFRC
ncbi:hypothetical protein B0T10DRAFT_126971 [Thelonectria olida]|uniref:Uncharacterized protein n=1 Tax=Thelonectria olida TaxID=1576542 RepID=A0A9P9AYS0_9HYPO|nr:hypothetical protein B0T10DRAFT_126971 [Thelonectria olida]